MMRRAVINVIACAGLAFLVVATARGQQPSRSEEEEAIKLKPQAGAPDAGKPDAGKRAAKSKLEELLAQALRNNADIRVATAKLNEAEAELHRARLQVMQKVVQSYQAVEAARATVDFRQKEYDRIKQLEASGAVERALVDEREKSLAAAKAQLAAAEADLSFLLGKGPAESRTFWFTHGQALNPAPDYREALLSYYAALSLAQKQRSENRLAPGPVTDKLRKALDQPVTIMATDQPLSHVLKLIRDANPDVHIQFPRTLNLEGKVTVRLENIPLGAAMQLLEDMVPDLRVVVRDYGLLLVKEDSLPPRALLLEDFWKGGKPKAVEAEAKAPPEVEGLVKAVDEKSGLMTLTIGSDAGLAKGQTLEIFRLGTPADQSKYLGQISIVEVTAAEAVAKPKGRLAVPPRSGDRVAARLLGK
jgi:hypothetical protein